MNRELIFYSLSIQSLKLPQLLPGTSSRKIGQGMFLSWGNLKELDCVAKETIFPRDAKKKRVSVLLAMPEWQSSPEVDERAIWPLESSLRLRPVQSEEHRIISNVPLFVLSWPLWISLRRLSCPKLPVGHD